MVKYYDMTSITNKVKDMTRLELDSIMNNNNYISETPTRGCVKLGVLPENFRRTS